MYPGALLEVETPPAPLWVCGNEVQIGQMITNLITNGRDALDGGSGVIEVETAIAPPQDIERFARFSSTPCERLVGEPVAGQRYGCLTVRDSGGGMPPGVMDRIFEPFYSTKGRERGTGLGLAVVHGVVRSHDGFCYLQSAIGKGTVFQVYLPLANETTDTATVQPACVQLGRVLIVDDQADVADALSIGLERLGYATVAVQDPLTALEAIEEDPAAFDTLLTDLQMPLMSGSELIRKARQAAPHLHIILCTGDVRDATEAQARSLGADRVLRKPVDIQSVA
jgi:CheY-like chemotaxis protein